MKRDPRLHGLSSEHHHALVLARQLLRQATTWSLEDGLDLGMRFDQELEPHFRIEEEVLLPALRRSNQHELVVSVQPRKTSARKPLIRQGRVRTGAERTWVREHRKRRSNAVLSADRGPWVVRPRERLQLVERTLADHAFLRACVQAARQGDGSVVKAFATRLSEHVRFEERELFFACEDLGDEVLEEVLRRAPKPQR